MDCILGKKWFKFAFLAYLMLAVTAFFALSNNNALWSGYYNTDNPRQDSFFSSLNYAVDCLAENITTINRANGHTSSPMRNGLFRVFILAEIFIAAVYRTQSFYSAIKNDENFTIKNSIILKLRI